MSNFVDLKYNFTLYSFFAIALISKILKVLQELHKTPVKNIKNTIAANTNAIAESSLSFIGYL